MKLFNSVNISFMALCKFMFFFFSLGCQQPHDEFNLGQIDFIHFVVFFLSETNEPLEADIWDLPLIVLNNFYDSCVLKEI